MPILLPSPQDLRDHTCTLTQTTAAGGLVPRRPLDRTPGASAPGLSAWYSLAAPADVAFPQAGAGTRFPAPRFAREGGGSAGGLGIPHRPPRGCPGPSTLLPLLEGPPGEDSPPLPQIVFLRPLNQKNGPVCINLCIDCVHSFFCPS